MLLRAVTVSPKDVESHYNLGAAYDAKQKYLEAMLHYLRAIELNRRHTRAHNNLGVDFARFGKLEKAEEYFRRATELDVASGPAN